MQVILLSDVRKVGKKYEVKNVSDGYALNFLIPKRLAEVATPQSLKKVEILRSSADADKKIQEDLARKNLESLKNVMLHLKAKVNAKGHLFKGIHTEEIAKALETEHKIHIHPQFIELDKPLKEVGEHALKVRVATEEAVLKVLIEAE